MKVTLFQYATAWMNPVENLAKIADVCRNITGTSELLVLPEMFNTGYTMKPDEIPVSWQEDCIKELTRLAEDYDLAICGSMPMFKSNKWHNTMITVTKDGLLHQYDKIHLFTPAGEKEVYAEGFITTCYSILGWKIKPLICYDLRFPYLSYNTSIPDVIIYSANWPIARIEHWRILLRARAIENQCYVIGVNRTGKDENQYEYPGNSAIIDYNGTVITEMDNFEGYSTSILHMDKMEDFRKRLPFLNDRKSNLFNQIIV